MTSLTTRARALTDNAGTSSHQALSAGQGVKIVPGTPEPTLHERFAFVAVSLVGKSVAVHTKGGKIYDGILHGVNMGADLGVALEIGGALMGNVLTFIAPGLLYTLLARRASEEE